MNDYAAKVDARLYEPKDKHPVIMKAFNNLKPGEKMELVNDHDPKPLHYMFLAEMPDQFSWAYLEQGPEVWRVAIGKV